MAFEIAWHCQQGTRTADNRDHAGVGIRGDSFLAIVLDGSTRGPTSGLFAQEIARRVVDWFVTGVAEVTADALSEQLRATHDALAKDFKSDSASYALLYAGETGPVVVLHAGDCLIGRNGGEQPTWLLQPHTLANAVARVPIEVLAKEPTRHILTRSFRSKRFMAPEQAIIHLDDRSLLVATDGFWAEMNTGGQTAFVNGDRPSAREEHDDRGVLLIGRKKSDGGITIAGRQPTANLYLRMT